VLNRFPNPKIAVATQKRLNIVATGPSSRSLNLMKMAAKDKAKIARNKEISPILPWSRCAIAPVVCSICGCDGFSSIVIFTSQSSTCATQKVAQANSLTLAFLHRGVGQISGHHHFLMLNKMSWLLSQSLDLSNVKVSNQPIG
jgi:hypothetical protein